MALVRTDEITGALIGPRPLSADVEMASLTPEPGAVAPPLDEAHQTFLIGADPPAAWPLDNNAPLPHAVTTPDDSAWPLPASSYLASGTPLPDVPEEDEPCLSPRSSTLNSSTLSSTRQSLLSMHREGSLPDLQTAVVATTCRASVVSPGRAVASMQFSSAIVPVPSGRLHLHTTNLSTSTIESYPSPVGPQHVDDSWEADIDYCYEHAVEASCDYEWAPMRSAETDPRAVAGTLLAISTDANSIPSLTPDRERFEDGSSDPVRRMDDADWDSSPVLPESSRPRRPTLLLSPTVAIPGLECSSAISSVHEAEVETPSQLIDPAHASPPFRSAFLRNPFKESGLFVVDHSLCLPPDDDERLVSEAMHGGVLGDGVHVVRHYSVQDSVEEVTESEMESCPSRSSLCKTSSFNSVDSQDGANTTSPRRLERLARTVPELVHSRRGSEELDTAAAAAATHQVGGNHDANDDASTQGPPSPRRRLTKKASSHGNLRYAAVDPELVHSYRERSQSDGAPKAAAAARRKVEGRTYGRQRSTSSFRGTRSPNPPPSTSRFSYVLFPTS